MATIYLPPEVGQKYKAYQARRPKGNDPFPNPQTDREEIVHGLWECGVMVAGWWLHETEQLRDMLQKYQVTQREEAERMEREEAERIRKKLLEPPPEEIAAAIKDVLNWQKVRRTGARRVYQGSGVTHIGETK